MSRANSRISASRRLAVLVRGVVSGEFVAMRSTRQKAVLMVSIPHGGSHPLERQVLCHGGRHGERRSLAVALRRTPQRRRRHVGTCRDVGDCREGPPPCQEATETGLRKGGGVDAKGEYSLCARFVRLIICMPSSRQ